MGLVVKMKLVIDWMNEHMRSISGVEPSTKVQKTFKDNNWIYKGTIYRGIHWGSYYELYNSPHGSFKINDKIKTRKFTSWTRNKNMASSFAAIGANDFWIVNDNNTYFPHIHDRICKQIKEYGGAGILIKGETQQGLDIDKAITEIEKTEWEYYLNDTIPMMFESEILTTRDITGKLIKHFHPNLC